MCNLLDRSTSGAWPSWGHAQVWKPNRLLLVILMFYEGISSDNLFNWPVETGYFKHPNNTCVVDLLYIKTAASSINNASVSTIPFFLTLGGLLIIIQFCPVHSEYEIMPSFQSMVYKDYTFKEPWWKSITLIMLMIYSLHTYVYLISRARKPGLRLFLM